MLRDIKRDENIDIIHCYRINCGNYWNVTINGIDDEHDVNYNEIFDMDMKTAYLHIRKVCGLKAKYAYFTRDDEYYNTEFRCFYYEED